MKLIIGLGNPGNKYKNNRHNVGHIFVSQIANRKSQTDKSNLKIVKTDCFMNESGEFVKKIVASNQPLVTSNLYVVHDDLDIPLGQFKIQFGVGPKVHNGVNSIEQALGTKEFWRVRIGVDNRGKGEGERAKGEEYVLQDFTEEERETLDNLFPKIYEDLRKHLIES